MSNDIDNAALVRGLLDAAKTSMRKISPNILRDYIVNCDSILEFLYEGTIPDLRSNPTSKENFRLNRTDLGWITLAIRALEEYMEYELTPEIYTVAYSSLSLLRLIHVALASNGITSVKYLDKQSKEYSDIVVSAHRMRKRFIIRKGIGILQYKPI